MNDGEQGHGSEMENSSQNNEHLRDKTGNNERRSDNDGTPPASHPLQLDEVSLNAIIAGVSTKLMSNPPVSGVMHSEPASQERQQQRQLVDTLTGELLVKLLIYNRYWHTHPAPPSGCVNLDSATPCIHTCTHTSNLLQHVPVKAGLTTGYITAGLLSCIVVATEIMKHIANHVRCFRASVAFVYYATVRAIANRIKCDFIFLIVTHLPQTKD